MSTTQLSLLSYNIHKGFTRYNRRYMVPDLRRALLELNPHIMCLQEVQGQHKQSRFRRLPFFPLEADYQILAEGQWPHHVYGQNATYKDGHHGNAILSQHPLINTENIDVSRYTNASRSLLHTEVPLAHMTLHIICVHLGLSKQERQTQYQQLAERIDKFVPHTAPLIIAGDFNDWRSHAEALFAKALTLQEAMKTTTGSYAKTFPAYRPTLRVDRIYYRGLNLLYTEVLSGKPWRYLSDHLPLFAKFEIPDHGTREILK